MKRVAKEAKEVVEESLQNPGGDDVIEDTTPQEAQRQREIVEEASNAPKTYPTKPFNPVTIEHSKSGRVRQCDKADIKFFQRQGYKVQE